jgi:ABC-type Na+ efflux pump permease subunit
VKINKNAGVGDEFVGIIILQNTLAFERDFTITFTTEDFTITREHIVTQQAAPATLSIDPANNGAPSGGETYTITVTSNASWTVSKSLNWVSVSPESGTRNGSVTVTVGVNTNTLERSGIITFSTGGLTEEHTITQQGSFKP